MAAVWAGLAVAAQPYAGHALEHPERVAVLLALAVFSVFGRDSTSEVASSSYTTVVLLAAVPLVGPLGAGVLGLIIALTDRRYLFHLVGVFNGLMMGVFTMAGGLVYLSLGGIHEHMAAESPSRLLWGLGGPLFAADIVMCVLNALILGAMVAVSGGDPRNVLLRGVRQILPLYLGYGVVAFLFVVLWVPAGVGPFSALLILAPLTLARFVYVQYGDEVRAHARMIRMMTAAADHPDGRLAAHSARVEEACLLIAGHLGLGEGDRTILAQAAVLHDIGMKGVLRAAVAQTEEAGSYLDLDPLLPHPEVAEHVLLGVDFLAAAAATVRGHHERIDGRGYPDGLTGEEIPLTARILAVADAFEALTSAQGDRTAVSAPQAIEELRHVAGTQLDPALVEALAEALAGREWPRIDDAAGGLWLWDQHALPAMSEIVAEHVGDRPVVEPVPSRRGEAIA